MALFVQKYGGTSVGSAERIEHVADKVAGFRAQGHDVVVVVSAMSGETNRLIELARSIEEHPEPREMDMLVSTGEQVTTALLCMALHKRQVGARSYNGSQVRILTDAAHTKARIQHIDGHRIRADLEQGRVVVVAGSATDADAPTAEVLLTHAGVDAMFTVRAVEESEVTSVEDLERLQKGSLPMERVEFPLAELLERSRDALQPIAESEAVELTLESTPEGSAHGDQSRILQVVVNLGANAIKHTPQGGCVSVSLLADDRGLVVEVEDDGPGIPEELRERVFERFFQVSGSDRRQGGTGLGLAISRLIVDQHDGSIEALEGADGSGSPFRARFPSPMEVKG